MDDTENDPDFFRKREQQERELARAAQDVSVRNIHLELAQSYMEQRKAVERKNAPDVR